ncbi:unnamed protein product, partial [Mesorhabditis belari]|uniref:non-specific serine/threonine protein kinase n=1 Tax=Mesorhabditis belari TaxID=2138241 RepID=A0AAF3FFK5_9BILA
MTSKTEVLGDIGGRGLHWDGQPPVPTEEQANSFGNNSSGNQLKLSIGCEDDEESLSEDELRERYRAWTLSQVRPAPPPVQQEQAQEIRVFQAEDEEFLPMPSSLPEDFGNELSQLLRDNRPLFQTLHDDHIAEEVWQRKPPKILNKYLFGDVIGEGSYAKVKEVVQEDTLMRCAVKIYKDRRIKKIPNGPENVNSEKEIMRKVNHPHCIKMFEFFRLEEKTKQYMVLEFCVASLQEIVDTWEHKRFTPDWAHYFFRQLIAGIEYLHALSIVHKDIKPANLLVSPEGRLKISDFGVAEQMPLYQNDDTCTNVQGTPKFQPPEIVGGHNPTYKGFAVDLWASGVTLYNLLSGEYPFEGDVIMKLFENICWQPLEMPKTIELEEESQNLLTGLLEKDPMERLKMDQVKHHPWFAKAPIEEKFDWEKFVAAKGGNSSRQALSVFPSLAQLYNDQELESLDGDEGGSGDNDLQNPLAPQEEAPTASRQDQQRPNLVDSPPQSEHSASAFYRGYTLNLKWLCLNICSSLWLMMNKSDNFTYLLFTKFYDCIFFQYGLSIS